MPFHSVSQTRLERRFGTRRLPSREQCRPWNGLWVTGWNARREVRDPLPGSTVPKCFPEARRLTAIRTANARRAREIAQRRGRTPRSVQRALPCRSERHTPSAQSRSSRRSKQTVVIASPPRTWVRPLSFQNSRPSCLLVPSSARPVRSPSSSSKVSSAPGFCSARRSATVFDLPSENAREENQTVRRPRMRRRSSRRRPTDGAFPPGAAATRSR
jgi:hypothetical protein